MSTLIDTAKSASYRDGEIIVQMASGKALRFPIVGNERLGKGSEAQLNYIEISPFGLHWPELDEDLSLRGILRRLRVGSEAQTTLAARLGRAVGHPPCAVLAALVTIVVGVRGPETPVASVS